ncbi:MAG TPA: hypothetical protein DDY98_04325, partial [Ruminococcaceae bacterium]|nr:hypothetical protein [Oscillospiraceae bacterium]
MNYQPNYAEHFSCLASACPDTCCAGWEIIVDKQSESYYKTLGGSLGDAVRQAMTTDEDGDTVFIQRNKRCPFLNEQNLCDLRTAIGWEHTSEICREHPRFTEEYDGFTEHSLSLSCPAVGKLIFSSPVASCYPPIQTKSTDEALNILASTRNELFTQLDESKTVVENIKLLFERSLSAQNQIAEIESEARFWDKIVYPNEDDLI